MIAVLFSFSIILFFVKEPPFQHPLPLRNQMDGLPLPPLPTKPTLGGVSPPGGMKPLMMVNKGHLFTASRDILLISSFFFF